MLTIDQLFTPPTAGAIRAQMVTNLLVLGIPADKWRAGGVASTILTVTANILAMMAGLISGFILGFFLPTATGDGLKLLAQYLYGVIVPSATFASGNLVLTNTGGGVYTKAAGEVTALNPSTGVTYTNTSAFSLAALGTVTVNFAATTVSGTAGNAAPGTITALSTVLLGVTVSNPASFVGVDAPGDDSIRALCLNKLGAMSVRGVRAAYAYAIQVAVNSVTGAPVNINRYALLSDSHIGTVNIYIASPSGAPSMTDLAGVMASVETNARPEAVAANVIGVIEVPYSPGITIWCRLQTGTSITAVQTAAANALADFISKYPIGGITANDDANPGAAFTGLFAAGVMGALAAGVTTTTAELLSCQGAIDLALTNNQVATDNTSISVRTVAPVAGNFGS